MIYAKIIKKELTVRLVGYGIKKHPAACPVLPELLFLPHRQVTVFRFASGFTPYPHIMEFRLTSDFTPSGDQPEAIRQLTDGLNQGVPYQTLLGVTGSGKTFTIANVIARLNRPVLVLSHNKTLAAQLYGEFREFFPNNAVEYFVSYYDYYQPEAYLPVTDTYIEKDLSINDEIEKLRLSATSSLLSGRRDVVVVSSVSCLYGIGNPDDFRSNTVHVIRGAKIIRTLLLRKLVDSLYARNEIEFTQIGRAHV